MKEVTPTMPVRPSPFAGSDWFDPLEEAVRGQVRSFIEELLEGGAGGLARPWALRARSGLHWSAPWAPAAPADHHVRPADALGAARSSARRGWRAGMEERLAARLQAALPSRRGVDRRGLPRRHEHPPGTASVGPVVRGPRGQGRSQPGLAEDPLGLAGLAGA